jgi:hypothetical protein
MTKKTGLEREMLTLKVQYDIGASDGKQCITDINYNLREGSLYLNSSPMAALNMHVVLEACN